MVVCDTAMCLYAIGQLLQKDGGGCIHPRLEKQCLEKLFLKIVKKKIINRAREEIRKKGQDISDKRETG